LIFDLYLDPVMTLSVADLLHDLEPDLDPDLDLDFDI